jgi:hypothetical protein
MIAAELFVNFLSVYAAVGVLFAVAFVIIGVSRVDPVAKNSTVGFRLIVLPGAALLWPLLLRRWIGKSRCL